MARFSVNLLVPWDRQTLENAVAQFVADVKDVGQITVGIDPKKVPTIHPNSILTYGKIASIMEYGCPTSNIPARNFLRNTVRKNGKGWQAFLNKKFRGVIGNSAKSKRVVILLAEKIQADARAMITKGRLRPRNAATTIRMKGFNKPLYETGAFVDAVIATVGPV